MKLVVQKVKYASVKVDDKLVGKIDNGFMVLVGITDTDTKETCDYLLYMLIHLKVIDHHLFMQLNQKYQNLYMIIFVINVRVKVYTLKEESLVHT